MDTTSNTSYIPQFETPHSGRGASKAKLAAAFLIILCAVVFNLWYYFGVFSQSPVVVVPEVVLPPTDEEKGIIATDLEARTPKIAIDDKALMIQSLGVKTELGVKLEDREVAVKSFQN